MMTAVEWLVDQMRQRKEQGLTLSFYDLEMFAKKAKAREKEKAIEFAKYCLDKAKDLDIRTAFMNVEEYYETFKQQEQ